MKKKLNKYLTGSSIKNYIETPDEVLAQNQIDIAKAKYEAETDPMVVASEITSAILGTAGKYALDNTNKLPMMIAAFGGKVDNEVIEVEGGEVTEEPDGTLKKYIGPNHESGGIKTIEPIGTDIYSKRLKIKDKSLADRKLARERKLKKLRNKLNKYNTAFDKKTFELETKKLAEEEMMDKKLQDIVTELFSQAEKTYATGTSSLGINPLDEAAWEEFHLKYPNVSKEDFLNNNYKLDDNIIPQVATIPNKMGVEKSSQLELRTPKITDDLKDYKINTLKDKFSKFLDNENSSIPTFGDAVGIGGQVLGPVMQYLNTLNNRAGDEKNTNFYKNYGQESLKDLNNTENKLYSLQKLLGIELDQNRNTAIERNSANARSINTKRALDLAVDSKANEMNRKIYSDTLSKLMQLDVNKANFKSDVDKIIMSGEEKAAEKNTMDRDNYYSQLSKNIGDIAFGLQNSGKSFNQIKYRTDTIDNINKLANSGIEYQDLLNVLSILDPQYLKQLTQNKTKDNNNG